MASIFVSHAYRDKQLVDVFVERIVQFGSGLNPDETFYSSGGETGVPAGANINEHVRRAVGEAGLVVALVTPAFEESLFCVAELGAAWSRSGELFPLILPGTSYDQIKGVLSGVAMRVLDDEEGLDELHVRLTRLTGRSVDARTWGTQKRRWLDQIGQLASASAPEGESQFSSTTRRVAGVGVHRSDGKHHAEIFRTTYVGQVEHSWIPSDDGKWNWEAWVRFEGFERIVDVAAVRDQDDRETVFMLADDGSVTIHTWTLEHSWDNPVRVLGRAFDGRAISITASTREPTQIDVFVGSDDGSVRMKWCWRDVWDEDGPHDGWYDL